MARVRGKFLNGSDFIQEAPSGLLNSSNLTYTLANQPVAGTVMLYLDGLYQIPTTHYSISGATITMVTAPATAQDIRAAYWRRV